MNMTKKGTAIVYYYVLEKIFRKIASIDHHIKKEILNECRTGCENCWAWKCRVRTQGQTPYNKFRRGKPPRKYKKLYEEIESRRKQKNGGIEHENR